MQGTENPSSIRYLQTPATPDRSLVMSRGKRFESARRLPELNDAWGASFLCGLRKSSAFPRTPLLNLFTKARTRLQRNPTGPERHVRTDERTGVIITDP